MKKILLLIFVSIQFLNAESIVTDRPDQTESALTVPKGSFQIESGFLYETESQTLKFQNTYKYEVSNENISYINSLFRYGLTEYLELRFATSYDKIQIQYQGFNGKFRGISDFQIGYKINILDGDFSLGILHHLITNSGTQNVSNDEISTFAKIAAAYSFTDNFNLSANIGYDYAESAQYIPLSLSFAFSITERLGLFTEIYGAYEFGYDKVIDYYNNGLTYLINDNLQADFSFGTGLDERYNFYSAGISWLIR